MHKMKRAGTHGRRTRVRFEELVVCVIAARLRFPLGPRRHRLAVLVVGVNSVLVRGRAEEAGGDLEGGGRVTLRGGRPLRGRCSGPRAVVFIKVWDSDVDKPH